MRGISSSTKSKIHDMVDDFFDRMSLRLLGDIPSLRNKKSIIFTSRPDFTLAHLFLKSLETQNPLPAEVEAMKNLLSTAEEYVKSLRSKTKAQLTEKIDAYVKEKRLKGVAPSSVDIKQHVEDAFASARSHFKTIAEAESTKARNMGRAMNIGKVASSQGVQDPNVFFVVIKDNVTCKECIRLHLLPDGMTPRVWKLSEVGFNYHKKGEGNPKIAGLHPHCFVGNKGIKVLTEHAGYINIKDVKVGHRVLTHTGKFKKVLNTLEYWNKPYYGEFYEISYRYKDRDGFKIFSMKVTPEHEFLTQNGWIKARDLDVKKHKLTQLKTPCANCGKTTEVKPRRKDKKDTEGYFCSKKCIADFQWKKPEHRDLVSEKAKLQMLDFVKNNPEKKNKMIEKANEATRKLVEKGIFWAQKKENLDILIKNISKINQRLQKQKSSKEELLVKSVLEETGIPFIHQEIVEKWTVDFFLPNHKVIVEYDGGGHYLPVLTGKMTMESFLAKQKGRDSYLEKCGYHILRYDKIPNKETLLSDIHRLSKNSNNEYLFETLDILSIKQNKNGKEKYKLYDLTVEDDESFVVNGIVSHNCRCSLSFLAPGFGFHNGSVSYVGPDHDEYKKQRGG